MEILDHGASHLSIVVYHKPNKNLNKLNDRLAERRTAFNKGELEQDLSSLKMAPQPFTWEALVSVTKIVVARGLMAELPRPDQGWSEAASYGCVRLCQAGDAYGFDGCFGCWKGGPRHDSRGEADGRLRFLMSSLRERRPV